MRILGMFKSTELSYCYSILTWPHTYKQYTQQAPEHVTQKRRNGHSVRSAVTAQSSFNRLIKCWLEHTKTLRWFRSARLTDGNWSLSQVLSSDMFLRHIFTFLRDNEEQAEPTSALFPLSWNRYKWGFVIESWSKHWWLFHLQVVIVFV